MKKMIISAILLVAGLGIADAQSQKKGNLNLSDTVFAIDEVEVTGYQKRANVLKIDVPLKYMPMATTSLSNNLLVKRDIHDIQEAVKFIPGVRIQTTYGAFQQMAIRGFDHSIIMVDGMRDERSAIDNSYPFMDLSSVQSIELLKGPASVLYGSSAVGGVVNIVRKSPEAKPSLNTRLAYGSYNNFDASLDFGGKLFGPLNYRASMHYQNQDGWRDNKMSRLSGYLAIGGKVTPNDEVDIRVAGNHDYYSTEIGLPPLMPRDIYRTADDQLYLKANDMLPGLNRKWRYNSESDFMYNRAFNISGQWKHKFSESLSIMDKLSYSYDDIDYFGTEELDYVTSKTDVLPYYYMNGDKRTYIDLEHLYYGYPLRFSHIANTINNQFEVSGKFFTGDIKHNYMGGYTYIYLNRVSYTGYDFGEGGGDDIVGPGLTGIGTVYNPHSIGWMDTKFSSCRPGFTNMHGFYLNDLVEFSRQWKMLVAGRYDIYRYKYASGIPNIDGKREHGDIPDDKFNKLRNGAFSFRVGTVYLPVDQLSLFASVGTYFKPIRSFYNEKTIYVDKNGNVFNPNKNEEIFKPEKGLQAELGARYEISNVLKVDFSMFYINKYNITRNLAYKGDEIKTGEVLEKNVVGQVGRMDSKGFDIEVTYTPVAGLMLMTGYAFTDAKVREMADNIYMDSDALKGKQFARIPRNTFFLIGDYVVQRGLLKGFGVNMDLTFHDKVYRNNNNTSQFDSYWLANLGFSYKLKNNIRLGLNIKNLFDKEYFNQSLGNQMVPSMPRNYMLSISYSL